MSQPINQSDDDNSSNPRGRATASSGRSCLQCKRRKIRCDRSQPCSYCVKSRIDCVYPPPSTQHPLPWDPAIVNVLSQLDRLEKELSDLKQQQQQQQQQLQQQQQQRPETDPDDHPLPSPTSGGESEAADTGKLVCDAGNSRYVTNSFWAWADQQENLASANAEKKTTSSTVPPTAVTSSRQRPQSAFMFGFSAVSTDLRSLHPTSEHAFTLWQFYLDSIDPLLKIFHTPTVQKQLLLANRDLSKVSASTEALMFAIYYSAVITMTPSATQSELNEDKAVLLRQYRFAVEQAFARADILASTDMTLLQAFVLYLICARRDEDKPDIWTLLSVAIRIATKLGLNHDGATLGLPPYTVEMRRRLWWHICILDVRMAEDYGMDPSILECTFNTRFPSNLNDSALDPSMSRIPTESRGRTDMWFCLVRFEISYLARKIVFSPGFAQNNAYGDRSVEEKTRLIDDLGERLEKQYMQFCDYQVPFDVLAATSIKMILAKLKLTMHRPAAKRQQQQPDGPQVVVGTAPENTFMACVQILEYAHTLRNHPNAKKWLWLFHNYCEWDALAFLLMELGGRDHDEDVDRAWSIVELVYREWKDNIALDAQQTRRWQCIETLREKASKVCKTSTAWKEPDQGDAPLLEASSKRERQGGVKLDLDRTNAVEDNLSKKQRLDGRVDTDVQASMRDISNSTILPSIPLTEQESPCLSMASIEETHEWNYPLDNNGIDWDYLLSTF